MSRKVFVGSLPNNIEELVIRAEFEKYGQVEEIFVKQGCEAGRQWAFVTFADSAQAQRAKELCDRVLTFPGSERPCDVMLAKNQGMGGSPGPVGAPVGVAPAPTYVSTAAPHANSALSGDGPRKIFVGSLPDDISDMQLRAEFSKYGQIEDTYIKQGCDPGRQWGFVTFASHQQALLAKQSTDSVLSFPGSTRCCEVTLARNQGLFGQDSMAGRSSLGGAAPAPVMVAPVAASQGPRKIFVGSLPDNCSEGLLRAEFSRYGGIVDMFLKTGCEPGRQWAFITYQTPEQADLAKNAADRTLVLPGGDRACEVMLARNQGKNGQDPMQAGAPGGPAVYTIHAQPQVGFAPPGGQPPPPTAPPPAHLTPWRTYYTTAGLPYYHNSTTGVTQWECPPDLQVPGAGALPGVPAYGAAPIYQPAPVRYAPF